MILSGARILTFDPANRIIDSGSVEVRPDGLIGFVDSRRSSGAASEEATVAGSAPGSEPETETIGKSTRGIAATGRNR